MGKVRHFFVGYFLRFTNGAQANGAFTCDTGNSGKFPNSFDIKERISEMIFEVDEHTHIVEKSIVITSLSEISEEDVKDFNNVRDK